MLYVVKVEQQHDDITKGGWQIKGEVVDNHKTTTGDTIVYSGFPLRNVRFSLTASISVRKIDVWFVHHIQEMEMEARYLKRFVQ
jgi:hypothetical protein